MKKHKDIILGAVFVAVIVAGAALSGIASRNDAPAPAAVAGGPAALVAASPGSFDFGVISMAKGPVRHDFAVVNSSTAPVAIDKIYTSCMCTEANLILAGGKSIGPFGMPGHGFSPSIGKILAPEATATIEAVFNPAAHGPAGVGKIQRAVVIEDAAGHSLQFDFSADVTP